jgi:hypothetical protein
MYSYRALENAVPSLMLFFAYFPCFETNKRGFCDQLAVSPFVYPP